MDTLPMLERRRIEAKVLGHVFEILKDRYGEADARSVIGDAVSQSAIEQGQEMARGFGDSPTLVDFASLTPQWSKEDALQIEMLDETEDRLEFNVTRCRYHEMYRDMGLGEIGDLLSCNRDGLFCTGFNPEIELTRTQTIMKGASHCDFRFKMKSKT